MNNQFIYTRKTPIAPNEPEYVEGDDNMRIVKDSINVNKIIRTITMDNGDVLVLLDDLHQRKQEVPIYSKQGKLTGYKNEMNAFQSEITILKEEVEAFYDKISVN